jgi:predicted transcriptional regulator
MKYEDMRGSEHLAKPLRRVTLTVDPDDYATLEALARRSDVSASWLVRRSIREFLERRNADRIDPTKEEARAEPAA